MLNSILSILTALQINPATADQCEFIRSGIRDLPAGATLRIPAGEYVCDKPIVVNRSRLRIEGAGRKLTTLKLAEQTPQPLLVLGDDQVIQNERGEWVTRTRIEFVEVAHLTVDGNLPNQDPKKECGGGTCDGDPATIRNNAITIRGASDILIDNVTAKRAVSGGLVTEKYCERLLVRNFSSTENYFDGFAGYQTYNSRFENVDLSRNRAAGISIDIDFSRNVFSAARLNNNGDVAIFARDVRDNLFDSVLIAESGNSGVFLGDQDHGPRTPEECTSRNEFRDVFIAGSKGYAFYIGTACPGNRVTGSSVLRENTQGCFTKAEGSDFHLAPEVSCDQ